MNKASQRIKFAIYISIAGNNIKSIIVFEATSVLIKEENKVSNNKLSKKAYSIEASI